jgi:hypothetical protein
MSDVLTMDEEGVLSMVRTMLAEARARSGVADMDGIKRAIMATGALVTEDTGDSVTYSLGTAHFTVRALDTPPGAIELSFQSRPA